MVHSAEDNLDLVTSGNFRPLITDSDEEQLQALVIPPVSAQVFLNPSTPSTTTTVINSLDLTDMSQNFMTGDPLSLDRIRSVLTRLEDTIIFSLIERAQFAHNPRIYQRGAFKELEELGFSGSWLDWFLKETEIFHGMYIPLCSHERLITD